MALNKLAIQDKKLFDKFLNLEQHELSTYAFQNIYIWKGLFDISWLVIEDSLCIFFQDKIGCFLYLAPLSKHKKPEVVKKVFEVLDRFNKNKDISRIENIEAKDAAFYQGLGLDCTIKSYDYLCERSDLVKLSGNNFKSKRACFNYFFKHYEFEYLPFSLKYKDECLGLYNCWMRERKTRSRNQLYLGMLEDSRVCLKKTLDNYADLNLIGRVVRINKENKAFTPLETINKYGKEKMSLTGFTFGFKLNPDTFCILYEITDLSIKGLAQFIFRSFCSELKDYQYINIMDDSGLENLKEVKVSYRPINLIPAYIVKRKDGRAYK